MQTTTSRSTRLATTVPALAAVLVTAMLVSMAMATGTAPRLASSVAVHAMLLGGSGQARESIGVAPRSAARPAPAPRTSDASHPPVGGHDVLLASLASVPGRGDLPPPARG
jgi:hypothetical protein